MRENSATLSTGRSARRGDLLCGPCFTHIILLDSHKQPYFYGSANMNAKELGKLPKARKQKGTKFLVWLAAELMFWRKNTFVWGVSSQVGIWEKAHKRGGEAPERGPIFNRFSHLEVSATKRWGFYSVECMQLLGFSMQLDLLQNKSWPETWLPRETAVGWDLRVASSEVSTEQTRSGKEGASCKNLGWYLPEGGTGSENSTALLVGSL